MRDYRYKNLLLGREDELKQEIINNRTQGFIARKLTNERIEEEIFKKPFLHADTAKELGWVISLFGLSSMEKNL